MPPDSSRPPAWYAKPFTLSFPAGIIAVLASILAGSVAAGGVGMATRDGDVAPLDGQVDARIDARIDARLEAATAQLRREMASSAAASEALALARYEEILRRLDRIERRIDEGGAR